MIKGRHIRHDWQTFVDWEQKSVRTVCGATTRRHLAGIPGITEQPETVEVGGRTYWGWCVRCVNSVASVLYTVEHETLGAVDPRVKALYTSTAESLLVQYAKMREKSLADEKHRHSLSPRHQSGKCLTDNRGCALDK